MLLAPSCPKASWALARPETRQHTQEAEGSGFPELVGSKRTLRTCKKRGAGEKPII